MSNASHRGKYADYSFEVGNDIARDGWYEHREGGSVLKIHYRAFRVPSTRKFVIRHYAWATDSERAEAERMLLLLPRIYPTWEADGRARRRRHAEGHYYWTAPCGSFLDDPLIQLELEMMADQSTGAST
ncbi:hypothetical protein JOF42_002342 [Microbacterium phyllosphaerae]|uniref:Uncharacterized protein n=1 Tax=Microbacterium phyllosphaerae TaxID=124798 RepID=A0ABS4WRM0_9MICO|nr:hypothetical protein [Microbacterium phyllosphaerae]MBP2378847.1 hypothetical protein [Microbacterium phyllosphaerae]